MFGGDGEENLGVCMLWCVGCICVCVERGRGGGCAWHCGGGIVMHVCVCVCVCGGGGGGRDGVEGFDWWWGSLSLTETPGGKNPISRKLVITKLLED